MASGAIHKTIYVPTVESFLICAPKAITEQRRIVAALNELGAQVTSAQKQTKELLHECEALRSAVVRKNFPSSESAAQVLGWRWERLQAVIDSTRNGLYTPEENYGSGTPVLKMFNIDRFTGRFELDRVDRVSLPEAELHPFRLATGDIVVNRVNSAKLVGKSALVTEREAGSVFESKNIRLRIRKDIADPSYVCAVLNSDSTRRQMVDGRKQIIGMATIDRDILDNIRVPLPPLKEQLAVRKRAADENSALDTLRGRATAQFSELDALQGALLRAAFSGAL